MSVYTPEYQPNGQEVAVFETDRGTIRIKLMGQGAPIHVANFVELANKGFYDGLRFHRLEPGFVVQGGCPNSRNYSAQELAFEQYDYTKGMPGTGGPGYTIKGEWQTNPDNKHLDGTLAMARSNDPDSAGSQFYFCLGPQPFLDGNYTVFGQPADQDSIDVIHALRKGDEIKSVKVENQAA
jgi:peptidyl-prolyl cis-trans isomerase B (cyclophilin B)